MKKTKYIDLDTPLELYIERGSFYEKRISTLQELLDTNKISYTVADMRPVVRGKWVGYKVDDTGWLRDDGTPVFITCDQCGAFVMNNASAQWNFCPNCGADMREES